MPGTSLVGIVHGNYNLTNGNIGGKKPSWELNHSLPTFYIDAFTTGPRRLIDLLLTWMFLCGKPFVTDMDVFVAG